MWAGWWCSSPVTVASGWRANCKSVRINDDLSRSLLILWYARPAGVSCFGDAEGRLLCRQCHSEKVWRRDWKTEQRVADGLVEALQVRPCLSCRKSEECYRQQCGTGSSQTRSHKADQWRSEVCGGDRMGQWEKNEDWKRRA
jgi:hypothetical protein